MSKATVAILNHGLRVEDVKRIPELIRLDTAAQPSFVWRTELSSPTLDIETFGSTTLQMNNELFWIGTKSLALATSTKWRLFLTEDAIQADTMSTILNVCRSLGASSCILVPDSGSPLSAAVDLVSCGKDVEEICQQLEMDYGLPAQKISDIPFEDELGYWHGDGYYRLQAESQD